LDFFGQDDSSFRNFRPVEFSFVFGFVQTEKKMATLNETQKKITLIVIGAGNRGNTFSAYANENPNLAEIIGVAEPLQFRRQRFVKNFGQNIPEKNIFEDWKEVAKREKVMFYFIHIQFADAVVVTTPDRFHFEPVIAFANLGTYICSFD
jgi:predicted dehydrogenase